jgi:hypothetical protein
MTPNALPESLRRLVDHEPAANPEIAYRQTHREGQLTASVHGNRVHVTVKLGRCWAALMNFSPSDEQLARFGKLLRTTTNICDFWLKTAVVCMALYIAIEIVGAIQGGAIERALAHAIGGR